MLPDVTRIEIEAERAQAARDVDAQAARDADATRLFGGRASAPGGLFGGEAPAPGSLSGRHSHQSPRVIPSIPGAPGATTFGTVPAAGLDGEGTVQGWRWCHWKWWRTRRRSAVTGMAEDEPASATKSGVEPGEVDLVDIDENDPPAHSASEPPAPSVGFGASAPASTASSGNLFVFGAVSTAPAAPAAPAAPVASLPAAAAAFCATAAAPAASTAAVAGGLGASVGTSNPFGAVVAKTSADFGGSTPNATTSLRSQQAEPAIPASTPATTEMRVQGKLSRVDAYGLCCLAWNAAANEVPLSINLEGVQASPETLAVACWALCPSVTSLSFKSTRLTADGANTVALERLCGLLQGGHAANCALAALNSSSNRLKDEGVSAVCEAIKSNKETKLASLNFKDNSIGPVGAKSVAAMVAVTGGLTKLSLARNELGEEGTKFLCDALVGNNTLKELDIGRSYRSNIGGTAGAKHVAKMLLVNGALTEVR